MKRLFYLLLLINAVYFGWGAWHLQLPAPSLEDRPSGGIESSPLDSASRLLLLSEVQPDELHLRTDVRHPDEKPATATATVPVPAPEPEVPEPKVPESTPEPDAPESAPGPASGPAPKQVAEATASAPDSGNVARYCYGLGPVPKKAADSLRQWLDRRGIPAVSRAGRREIPLHWIYLPPFSTQAGAERAAASMRADNIGDIFILSRGNMKNAISLGVFRKRSSMEKRLDELKKKGYTAQVGSRSRTEKITSFQVTLPADAAFPKDDIKREFPSLAVREMACE